MEERFVRKMFEGKFLVIIPFGWARNFIKEFNESPSSFAKNKIQQGAEAMQVPGFEFHALLGNWAVLLEIDPKDLSEFEVFLKKFSQRMQKVPDPIF